MIRKGQGWIDFPGKGRTSEKRLAFWRCSATLPFLFRRESGQEKEKRPLSVPAPCGVGGHNNT
jgi:hypothetical protein